MSLQSDRNGKNEQCSSKMAACTELEIEEKSSEKGSHSVGNVNDCTFFNSPSNARCNAAWNVNNESDPGSQWVESETGDLKKLSDDEFIHLLEEAITFNKPNNQESILLKQLRKEVADSDSCENVGHSEAGSVSKRVDRRCSKLPYASSCSEPLGTSHASSLKSIPTTLPARTLQKTLSRKSEKAKDSSTPVLLSFTERNCAKRPPITHHIVEIETNNNQWTLKPVKPLDSNLAQLLNACSDDDDNYNLRGYQERLVDSNDSEYLQKHNMVKLDEQASSLATDNHGSSNDLLTNNCTTNDPQEIELMELKRSKNTKDQDIKNDSEAAEKRSNGSELSNSKFYVNCNDVDATVTFPLKFVSAPVDDRSGSGLICDAMTDQSKRLMNFPCFSWPRTQPVHSFLGSLPVDQESLQSQNDADGLGNPFARSAYAANVASFMSATFVDYPSSAIMADSQSKYDMNHRKFKRTRNNAENRAFILAENIAGHRGNEDIDSLVKFIEAADKNNKALNRANHSNQILKNIPAQDVFKRKVNGKDSKSSQNSKGLKKKTDEASSTAKPKNLNCENKTLSSESELSDDSICNNASKVATVVGSNIATQCLDINSNVMDVNTSCMEGFTGTSTSASEDLTLPSCETVTYEMSSFSADFYAFPEALPQQVEESGFRIVKKKQRKRHQGKRSENYRWHSAAARVRQSTSGNNEYYNKEEEDHDGGMMLLSNIQRNQCSKQDSRRKSTSSVPHSDQSSADNSDLDSVHSLPVRGSAPHPTKMHPHTTPSSSSSTPQASYADIARMPVSSVAKVNGVPTTAAPVSLKPVVIDSNQREQLVANMNSYDKVLVKENDLCTTNLCEATSFSSAKLTREINTQTEPLSENLQRTKEDSNTACNEKKTFTSGENKNTRCSTNCSSKNCTCSKSDKAFPSKPDIERVHRPAVVMMGNIPSMEASDISFGVDFAEILQMSSSDSTDLNDSGVASHSPISNASCSEKQPCDGECCSGLPALSSLSKSSFDNCSIDKCDASDNNLLQSTVSSSPNNELRLASGQRLQFAENEVNLNRCNFTEIVALIAQEWKNVHKELTSDINKSEEKVKYYKDTY